MGIPMIAWLPYVLTMLEEISVMEAVLVFALTSNDKCLSLIEETGKGTKTLAVVISEFTNDKLMHLMVRCLILWMANKKIDFYLIR